MTEYKAPIEVDNRANAKTHIRKKKRIIRKTKRRTKTCD